MLNEVNEKDLKKVVGGTIVPSGQEIVYRATQELGKPYEWGKCGPDAYDNSGFVSYCICGINVHIGTVTTFLGWPRVSNPEPGDICVNSAHCGIYVGNGQMIHAPSLGQVVSYGSVQSGMIFVRYQ